MQLTQYTDYSFRVLIYLGLRRGELATIREIAEHFGISRNHLVKVAHQLGVLGYVRTVRGKHGGITLGAAPEQINLGEVARHTEDNLTIVECFNPDTSCCRIQASCSLKSVFSEALEAFFRVLDRYTLADLLTNSRDLADLLAVPRALAEEAD